MNQTRQCPTCGEAMEYFPEDFDELGYTVSHEGWACNECGEWMEHNDDE